MHPLAATFAPPLEALLRPIPGPDPGGEWLRYSETYDAIQEARRADDPSLPRGIWQHELKKADWGRLSRLCEEAIETRSKDLYLAVWLVEGWFHEYGLAGLAAGLRLLSGLSSELWESLYPRLDSNDPEVRSAPFEWLNDRVPIALGTLRISEPAGGDAAPCSWAEVLSTRSTAAPAKRPAKGGARGNEREHAATAVQKSIALTPAPWLEALARQVGEAITANEELAAVLLSRIPDAPPSVRRIDGALREMQRWLAGLIEVGTPSPPAAEEPAPPEPRPEGTPPLSTGERSMSAADQGPVQSREEAYRLLSLAADYLLRTEPHSPTPYLVQRAVGWGRMPLAELLEEYSQDGNDLRMLRLLLGLSEKG